MRALLSKQGDPSFYRSTGNKFSHVLRSNLPRPEKRPNVHFALFLKTILVPRGHAPFGQHQESRPLAMSNYVRSWGGQKYSKCMKMYTPTSLWCYCSYALKSGMRERSIESNTDEYSEFPDMVF